MNIFLADFDKYKYFDGEKRIYTERDFLFIEQNITRTVNVSAKLAVGLAIPINWEFSLLIEPNVKMTLLTVNEFSPIDTRLFSAGLGVGIRYNLFYRR